jgi:hypothetical protein
MCTQLGIIVACSLFNPLLATYRLEQTTDDRTARVLSAWSVSSKASIAAMTALWGVLAGITGLRPAIAAAAVLSLATPLLLPRHTTAGLFHESVGEALAPAP